MATQLTQLTTHEKLSNGHQIDTKTVYKLFKQQLSGIQDNENDILQIVHILGGIETILDEFFSNENNIHITQTQLQKLHQLLSTPQKYQSYNKTNSLTTLKSLNKQETIYSKEDEMCYKFDISDTVLNSLFAKESAKKPLTLIHTTTAHFIWAITLVAFLIIRLFMEESIIYPIYTLIVCGIAWHFYIIGWILSANRKSIKLLSKSFEFWFKILNVCTAVCIYWIGRYYFNPYSFGNTYLRIGADIGIFSNIIFVVVIISMFDTFNINRIAKITLSTCTALGFSVVAIQLKTMTFYDGDRTLISINRDNNIYSYLSLMSIQINVLEILAIFSWKQTFFTIIKKNRCVLIKYSPHIEWIDNKSNNKILSTVSTCVVSDANKSYDNVLNTNKYVQNKINDCHTKANEINEFNMKSREESSSSTVMSSQQIDNYSNIIQHM
eukprot:39035_1